MRCYAPRSCQCLLCQRLQCVSADIRISNSSEHISMVANRRISLQHVLCTLLLIAYPKLCMNQALQIRIQHSWGQNLTFIHLRAMKQMRPTHNTSKTISIPYHASVSLHHHRLWWMHVLLAGETCGYVCLTGCLEMCLVNPACAAHPRTPRFAAQPSGKRTIPILRPAGSWQTTGRATSTWWRASASFPPRTSLLK